MSSFVPNKTNEETAVDEALAGARHTVTHVETPPPRTMLAQKISIAAKTTTTVASKTTTRRGQTIVRKNSKGGEEGARAVRTRQT
jgi:hypothetical protein